MSAEHAVLLDNADRRVPRLIFNRPSRLNAIDDSFIEAMHDALDRVSADPDARALVVTGVGRVFCAGADLKEAQNLGARTTEELYRGQQRLADMSVRLHELPIPVVAAVNGAAAGGGFALAAACDLRVASADATFLAANVRLGISGGEMGLSWLLPQVLGLARASELLLSGRKLGADQAHAWGFVNRLVDPERADVVEVAAELAGEIADNPAFGVRLTKEMLRSTATAATLREAVTLENRTQVLAAGAGDIDRATSAFRGGTTK